MPSTLQVGSGTKQRAHRPDFLLLLYAGLLMLLGLVIMYAIGPQIAQTSNSQVGEEAYSSSYYAIKQLINIAVASVAMGVMIFMPFKFLKKHAGAVLAAGLIISVVMFLLSLVHASSIVPCVNGACRWISLGPFGTFQPAELLKFGVLVFFARFLAVQIKAGKLNDWKESVTPLVIVALVVLFFVVVLQKDMGTGIALASIMVSMIFVAGINWQVGWRLLVGALILFALLVVAAPHRMERMATFFRGDVSSQSANSLDEDYQSRHAKIAIGTGGLTGVGIGNSVAASGYLPEAINDSLFAILGETFGFVGLVALIALLSTLLLRILRIVDHSTDAWMKLIAAGIFGWLFAHTALNIASMIGIAPLTGITLPLLSFGGTSMLFIAAALGLLFQVSRYTSHDRQNVKEVTDENTSRRRRVRWSRDTGYRRAQ